MLAAGLLFAVALGDPLANDLTAIAEKAGLPALGVSVVTSKGEEWSHYSGVKKLGGDDKVSAETKWHLGSCTKAMTALAVCRQVEAGKLDLGAPLAQVFPGTEVNKGFEAVTLRHLMAHQAGLVPNLEWWKQKSRGDAIASALGQAPESEVGKYVYSNTGFVVAGWAAERAGKPIEELLQKEMAALGVTSLGFGPTGEKEAWPHIDGKPVDNWRLDNPPVMAAAGTAHMTLPDWGKYISAMLKGLRGEESGLPAVYFEEIKAKKLGGEYTMGWVVTERPWAGRLALNHAGSNSANFAVVWIAPEKDYAILVVTNSGGNTSSKAANDCIGAVIRSRASTY